VQSLLRIFADTQLTEESRGKLLDKIAALAIADPDMRKARASLSPQDESAARK
jgi:hypothetical protein